MGKMILILKALVHEPDLEWEFIEKLPVADFTIVNKGYDNEEVRDVIRKNNAFSRAFYKI